MAGNRLLRLVKDLLSAILTYAIAILLVFVVMINVLPFGTIPPAVDDGIPVVSLPRNLNKTAMADRQGSDHQQIAPIRSRKCRTRSC